MNSNLLAEFEYNGKTYVYYVMLDKPKNLLYGYLENDVIKEVTDPKDASIMQEAYKKIFISSDPLNYIKLETIKHRGKLMQVMLDKVSNIKFFYEIKDGKYYWPTKQDAQELFNIFYDDVLYRENVDKNKKAKRKKKLTIEKAIAILGTVIFVTIGADFLFTKYIVPEYPQSNIVIKYNEGLNGLKSETSAKDLEEALYSNPNLTDAEKEFFKDQIPLLIKYRQYVDFDNEIFKFSTLRTEYNESYCIEKPDKAGCYTGSENKITIYNAKNFEESPKEVLGHEGDHAFSSDLDPNYTGVFEGTTEIVTSEREYADGISSYKENCAIQKVLYQIIGSEPFIAFKESGKIKYIKDALFQVIQDENLSEQLFSALNNIIKYNSELYLREDSYEYSEEEIKEAEENANNSKQLAIDIVSKYFYAAKGFDIKESAVAMIYLKSVGLIDDDIYLLFNSTGLEPYPIISIDLKKGYFEDGYIKKYPEFKLEYNSRGVAVFQKSSFILDPNTRLIKTEKGYILNTNVDKNSLENQKSSDPLLNVVIGLYTYDQNDASEKKFPLPYVEQSSYVRILCEIIGVEPFNRYLANGDQNEIINALLEINPDINEAMNLINKINFTTSYYEDNNFYASLTFMEEDCWDINDDMHNSRNQIYKLLNNYFMAVYGYPIAEDALASIYYKRVVDCFSCNYDMEYSDSYLPSALIFFDELGNEIVPNKRDFYVIKKYFTNGNSSNDNKASVNVRVDNHGDTSVKNYTLTDENRRLVASQENPGSYVFTAMPFEDEPAKGY